MKEKRIILREWERKRQRKEMGGSRKQKQKWRIIRKKESDEKRWLGKEEEMKREKERGEISITHMKEKMTWKVGGDEEREGKKGER